MRVSKFELIAAFIYCLMTLDGFSSPALSQWTMGSRAVALAKAGTALPSDNWAVFHNPAMIATGERHFGVFAIRNYGFRELEDHAVTISFPVLFPFFENKLALGVAAGIHSYGFKLFRETQFRGGWSLHRNRLRFGMVMNYAHLKISGYGSTGSPILDAGVSVQLNHNILAGYRASNLFIGGSGDNEIGLYPAEMAFGLSWYAIPQLLIISEIVKDVLFPISIRTAMELEGSEGIFFRGGWTTQPLAWSAGAGFQLSKISVNIAVQKHAILGFSPGLDCSLAF